MKGDRNSQITGKSIPSHKGAAPLQAQLESSFLKESAGQECVSLTSKYYIFTKPAGDAQYRCRLLHHQWQSYSATAQAIENAVAKSSK